MTPAPASPRMKSTRVTSTRRALRRSEQGAALVFALIFLSAVGISIGALMKYSMTNSAATTALRAARGNIYDAAGAMNGAIAKVRTGGTCGTGASGFTPASTTLNITTRTLRVDCFALSSTSTQRSDVFSVCLTTVSAPCPDSSALLRANLIFYDTPTTGTSLSVQTWSNT